MRVRYNILVFFSIYFVQLFRFRERCSISLLQYFDVVLLLIVMNTLQIENTKEKSYIALSIVALYIKTKLEELCFLCLPPTHGTTQ